MGCDRGVIRFGNRVRSRVNRVEQMGCDRGVIRFGNGVRSRDDWVEEKGCDRGVIQRFALLWSTVLARYPSNCFKLLD
jgi:hypothetical protein